MVKPCDSSSSSHRHSPPLFHSTTTTTMASTLSLSFPLDPQNLHTRFISAATTTANLYKTRPFTLSTTPHTNPLPSFHPHPSPSFRISSSQSQSPSSATLDDPSHPFLPGRFLTNEELQQLESLEAFLYSHELESGTMWVRVMRAHEVDAVVGLLAESFAESMLLPAAYVNVLAFLVKQYLVERRALMPYMATLVGFYKGVGDGDGEGGEMQMAGTVEVCFDRRGANSSVPSPAPPKDSPYICNMAVQKSLRRRGIGWHLLKASEELISQMSSSREVYLHCRMIDAAPFNMYTKAGYKVMNTDSILVLLMLQRRKHLMCKNLPLLSTPPETDLSDSDM
ncbi:GCN5-related N-acetyltransferase 5, chloroplastic [Lotus japonicus]|uniref:GCN5-related N-acetyltransferase 5, chloroplastic n=1 Tax=Lotus japonicus TaxID=34305 RepID=UPI0025865F9A|nr:GCN5-related N-acetyltransferase 5, chloroplastic [Lotus japonicus]